MISFQFRTSLIFCVRLCVALFVLLSANHCFLEEGLGTSSHPSAYTKDFSKLNYHFGTSFAHDHPASNDDDSASDHSHGDTASLNQELPLQKIKKFEGQALVTFMVAFLSSAVEISKSREGQPPRNSLVPLNELFVSRGVRSLVSAPQAPPVSA